MPGWQILSSAVSILGYCGKPGWRRSTYILHQMAAMLVLEPIFEADMPSEQYAGPLVKSTQVNLT
jgi:hypothetical protein